MLIKCADCDTMFDPRPTGRGPSRQRCEEHVKLRKAEWIRDEDVEAVPAALKDALSDHPHGYGLVQVVAASGDGDAGAQDGPRVVLGLQQVGEGVGREPADEPGLAFELDPTVSQRRKRPSLAIIRTTAPLAVERVPRDRKEQDSLDHLCRSPQDWHRPEHDALHSSKAASQRKHLSTKERV